MLPLFDDLFPAGVSVAGGAIAGDIASLMPEEERVIARAVFKRRREFAAGRHWARAALATLGIRGGPLLPGPQREPLWPEGVVGSITHSDSVCAAAVAFAEHYRGIGIDLELDEPLSADLVRTVCCPDEVRWLAETPVLAPMVAARVVFCAKESIYKCQFPMTREFLNFEDISVRLASNGNFLIERCREDRANDWATRLQGRWKRVEGCIIAATWIAK